MAYSLNNFNIRFMLLDLSAAFDTVDHNVILKILNNEIGIKGNAL